LQDFSSPENELLETDVDEISEMASRRDIQEEKKAREIIADLQTQVEELRYEAFD
jgi:hypothetical protein